MRHAGLFFLLLLAAFGQQQPSLPDKPTGFLTDAANVVDAANRAAIEQYAASLQQTTGAEVAVVTVASLNGEPIEDFANTLYRKWGIGQKGSNEGLLMLLAIGDRKVRVEVGYGLEPILTDGYVGSVQRSIRVELRESRFGDAIRKALEAFGQKIAQAKGASGGGGPVRRDPPRGPAIPWWMLIGLGLFVLVFFILPGFGRRRGGGYGGGYFPGPFIGGGGFGGSSDGGGGGSDFGGFGGGDSGGGGASSDW